MKINERIRRIRAAAESLGPSDPEAVALYGRAEQWERVLALVEAAEKSAVIASGSSSSFGSPAIEMLLNPALAALREHGDI